MADQGGFWDREVEDQELEYAIGVTRDRDTRGAVREMNGARKVIRKRLRDLALRDGERLRVGRFVVTGLSRAGGGFELREWESVGMGAVVEVDR